MGKIKTHKFLDSKSKNSIADKTIQEKAKKLALLMVKQMEEKMIPDLKVAFYSEIKNLLDEIKNKVIEQDGFANGLESRISELEIRTGLMPSYSPNTNKTKEALEKEQKTIFDFVCKTCGKELKEGHKCEPEPEHFDLHDKIIPQ